MVGKLFPVGSLNQSDNTAWRFRGATVVLTGWSLVDKGIDSRAVQGTWPVKCVS